MRDARTALERVLHILLVVLARLLLLLILWSGPRVNASATSRIPNSVLCRMLISSILAASITAIAQDVDDDATICSYKASRARSFVMTLLSFTPAIVGGSVLLPVTISVSQTAATTTGPASGPRPASSMPSTCWTWGWVRLRASSRVRGSVVVVLLGLNWFWNRVWLWGRGRLWMFLFCGFLLLGLFRLLCRTLLSFCRSSLWCLLPVDHLVVVLLRDSAATGSANNR